MLLIDGAKYEEWTPANEDEFEQVVKEHAKDIFGEESIYFDLKKKLKTKAGIGSIPDGYVISFREPPCWYICEVELHTHPLYEHIIAQLQKIVTAAKTLQSQKVVTDAIYSEIKSAPFKEALIKRKIGTEDLHHFIANLISKPPILVIPIDQKIGGLEEACDGLPIEEVRIVEFRTLTREEIGLPVHAHLFEPVHEPTKEKQKEIMVGGIGRKVTAGHFYHKGNGTFALKSDPSVTIDVRKRIRLVGEQLAKRGLRTKRLTSFYWLLRRKADLLNTPTEG